MLAKWSETVCNKADFENLCSKHNQKVTECEDIMDGKEIFGKYKQGRQSFIFFLTSFSKCPLLNWDSYLGVRK